MATNKIGLCTVKGYCFTIYEDGSVGVEKTWEAHDDAPRPATWYQTAAAAEIDLALRTGALQGLVGSAIAAARRNKLGGGQ